MKEKYRKLCETEATIPFFSQSWWLDAVCGEENWDVCIHEKGGQIKGSMPYFKHKRFGQDWLTNPPLTQTLGPWIKPSNGKYQKLLGQQKDVMQALIKQLPKYHYFSQNWHYSNQNWLPFHWEGFSQSTRYTYILPDLGDEKKIWEGLATNIRTDVRKASERFELSIDENASIESFLELNTMVFSRQGKKLPYSEELVRRIDKACGERDCRKILIARDKEGRAHAGVYIVWDNNSAYYIMGGGDPELRNSGATSLCMWEAIVFAAGVTKQFDFEGSMLEPVERFFRAFGAIQTSYFSVSKTNSKALGLVKALVALKS